MKKKKIFKALMMSLFIPAITNGQTYWNGSSTVQTTTTGSCTIGGNLAVKGGIIDLNNSPSDNTRQIVANSANKSLEILSGHSGVDGAWIGMNALGLNGKMNFHTVGGAGTAGGFNFYHYDNSIGFINQLTIDNTGTSVQKGNLFVKSGIVDLTNPASDNARQIIAHSNSNSLQLFSGHGGATDGGWISLNSVGVSIPGERGNINLYTAGSASSYNFYNVNASAFNQLMKIQADGKVVIGAGIMSNAPNNYKLYVEQGILTERIRVANKSDAINWADFVFAKDYDLMPLHKVEEFIQNNKHLPEIPSAAEVAKDGIDIAEMDAKLLQKIEELTLYVIKQQKEIDQLKRAQRN